MEGWVGGTEGLEGEGEGRRSKNGRRKEGVNGQRQRVMGRYQTDPMEEMVVYTRYALTPRIMRLHVSGTKAQKQQQEQAISKSCCIPEKPPRELGEIVVGEISHDSW